MELGEGINPLINQFLVEGKLEERNEFLAVAEAKKDGASFC